MNKRWKKKIDIYMGNNKEKAKKWGEKKVTIYWSNTNS
jgi:3D (Asp-Asp-Asp) domain-containing protein